MKKVKQSIILICIIAISIKVITASKVFMKTFNDAKTENRQSILPLILDFVE